MRNLMLGVTSVLLVAGINQALADEGLRSVGQKDKIEETLVIGQPSRFGSTKSEIPVMETPRSVVVISAKEFLDRGSLSLSNTLDYTAGVTGNAFGFATRGDFTSIRGLDAPEYQDNLQVLFGFYNNARADIYTLEQVEVLKGPASVLYGQAAPGGIVSTVSKVAGSNNQTKEVVFTAGSNNRLQASVDIGLDLSGDGRWTTRLVGVLRESDTPIDFVNDDALVLAPSLTYENDSSSITALINYTDRESDTSSQFLPLAATACGNSDVTISEPNVCAGTSGSEVDHSVYVGDPNFNKFDTEAITVSIFGTHRFNDVLSIEGTARYRDNEAEYDQTWISFLGDGNPRVLSDGTAVGRSWNSNPAGSTQYALDARLRAIFETGSISHELLVGVNYQDVETFSDAAFLYAQPTTFNIFNPIYDGSEVPTAAAFDAVRAHTEDSTAAADIYITDHMNIGKLVLSAGIRLSSVESEDAINDQEDKETPINFGVLYKTEAGLNPYLSYSESFRATVGSDIVTGTSLRPRKGEQAELGFKYQPTGSESYVVVSYFDLEENNLVEFVTGGRTQPGLSIETDGFEIEARVVWRDFAVDVDFRHLNATDVDVAGNAVTRPSLPDNAGSVWTSWESSGGEFAGIRVGLGARYASENESNGTAFLAVNGFSPTPNRVVTDGYTVFDAMLAYEFDGFDVSLNVRNLANEQHYATCLSRGDCFVGEQRSIVGRIAKQF